MNIFEAIDRDVRREISGLRRENQRLRRQLDELDNQARSDRQTLAAALMTLADRNAEIERIRTETKAARKIMRNGGSTGKK